MRGLGGTVGRTGPLEKYAVPANVTHILEIVQHWMASRNIPRIYKNIGLMFLFQVL